MEKELPVRKSPRLDRYDYSLNGAYFITVCVQDRHEMLGSIDVGAGSSRPHVELSEYGCIVNKWIAKIPEKYDCAKVENYIIMPNHTHILLFIYRSGRDNPAPTVGNIIGYFKYQTTKEINIPGFWQRSYHDRIIRDKAEYRQIWQYIDENPARWAEDEFYK